LASEGWFFSDGAGGCDGVLAEVAGWLGWIGMWYDFTVLMS